MAQRESVTDIFLVKNSRPRFGLHGLRFSTRRTTLYQRKKSQTSWDFFLGAGNGSRTRISSLARTYNSRYTIPAIAIGVSFKYQLPSIQIEDSIFEYYYLIIDNSDFSQLEALPGVAPGYAVLQTAA